VRGVVCSVPSCLRKCALQNGGQEYLEEAGELGVPVWDVLGLAVHQGGDHVPQGGQRQVDLGRLLCSPQPSVRCERTVARDFRSKTSGHF
jgi:hypothetical protein